MFLIQSTIHYRNATQTGCISRCDAIETQSVKHCYQTY